MICLLMEKTEKELLLKGVQQSLNDLATYSRLYEEARAEGDENRIQLYDDRVETFKTLLYDFIKDLIEERKGE